MKYLLLLFVALLHGCGGGSVEPAMPEPVITPAPVAVPEPIPTPDAVKAEALLLINALRFFGGCGNTFYGPASVLVWSDKLESEASLRVQAVVSSAVLPTSGPAEILTQSYPTVRETVTAGLSAQDCDRIMNPSFKEIGLSSAQINPTSFDFYWSIILGAGQ